MTYLFTHLHTVGIRLWEHVLLSGTSLIIALAIAFPLALYVARGTRAAGPLLAFFGAIYTIPSLALFALLVPLEGLGFWTAVTALVAYAQMILVRNIATAIRGVDAALIDVATGMGMTPRQAFLRVTLPQALPGILAGVRVATVSVIAIATVAAFINAGGLGTFLFSGLQNDDSQLIVTGAVTSAALAIVRRRPLAADRSR